MEFRLYFTFVAMPSQKQAKGLNPWSLAMLLCPGLAVCSLLFANSL